MLSQLARAVASLAHSTTASHLTSEPLRRTKIREPDQFDSSEPQKLRMFLVQCELNFQDCPRSFDNDCAKVIYAQSYLKGMALDWFEPELLLGNPDFRPHWMDDYLRFTHELQVNFGPHDPVGDVEHCLDSLSMSDNQRITKYVVEFNRHVSQVRGVSGTIVS